MEKYREAETFDFKNDLSLWIEYIGNPDRNYPPIAVTLVNPTNEDCLIQIFKDGVCVDDDLLNRYEESSYPMFVNEEYIIKVLNADSGAEISSVGITPDFRNRVFSLDYSAGVMEAEEESFYDLQARTMEHINAQNFDGRTLTRLNTLARVLGVDKTKDKALRGAFLEYYFFKILKLRTIFDFQIFCQFVVIHYPSSLSRSKLRNLTFFSSSLKILSIMLIKFSLRSLA